MEKLEPLELKMKTHIDNILHPQEAGGESNPLRYHANLDDLDSSSDSDEKTVKSGIYIPPKIAAVPYSEKGPHRVLIGE